MSEAEMKNMQQPLSTPPSQQETIYSHYSPKLAKRMQQDTCYTCKQIGHWSWDCPSKFNNINNNTSHFSPNNNNHYSNNTKPISSPSSSPINNHYSNTTTKPFSPSSPENIWCRCGHGFCEVRTVQNGRNKGRKYYACPIKRGKSCTFFYKWCDDGKVNESDRQPPPYKYPECECRAGVCAKVEVKESSGMVKYYFTCPVGEFHGSCGYCVWEDEVRENETIVTTQQSGKRTLNDFSDETDNDLGKAGYLLVENFKRMRAMDKYECNSENLSPTAVYDLTEKEDAASSAAPSNGVATPDFEVVDEIQEPDLSLSTTIAENNSENPSSTAVYDLTEKEDAASSAAPSNGVRTPDFEVVDDLQVPDLSLSTTSIKEEAGLLSHQSTTSRISCRENVFERLIFAGAVAAESFCHCPMGWLGRLLFVYPNQSLKVSPPQPVFCRIFPSFNAIVVPKQASIGDGLCVEFNQLAISDLSQHGQLSTGCHTEVSTDAVTPPNKSPGSVRTPMSKEKKQRQMALFAQQQLLDDLESLGPNEHESMREAAEYTFDILDHLGVNYEQFYVHVCDYIDLASSVTEMDRSMENSLTLDEYNKRIEEERVKFSRIQDDLFNTETLLKESNQRRQTLIEEVSHLEAMLHQKQTQLKSCELENQQIETRLGDLRRTLMEADANLKVIAEEAKVATQFNVERQAKQIAAKTALEKAKLELEN